MFSIQFQREWMFRQRSIHRWKNKISNHKKTKFVIHIKKKVIDEVKQSYSL